MHASINWLATIVAALSSFVVGGIWYSPRVFCNPWMKDSKLTEADLKAGNTAKIFGFTALFSLIMAINLAMFLNDPKTNATLGTLYGFLAGIWGFCAIAIHSLFEQRPWRHIFINGCYILVALSVMGAIIGAWR